jgi:hypothetical protein
MQISPVRNAYYLAYLLRGDERSEEKKTNTVGRGGEKEEL